MSLSTFFSEEVSASADTINDIFLKDAAAFDGYDNVDHFLNEGLFDLKLPYSLQPDQAVPSGSLSPTHSFVSTESDSCSDESHYIVSPKLEPSTSQQTLIRPKPVGSGLKRSSCSYDRQTGSSKKKSRKDLPPDELHKKRERNRKAAEKYRQKGRQLVEEYKAKCDVLQEENNRLHVTVDSLQEELVALKRLLENCIGSTGLAR